MAERLFAPAILFVGADRPAEELAQHLRVYCREWLPEGQPHEVAQEESEGGLVVYFPMSSAEFVSWGAMLTEDMHAAALGADAAHGNEFMACFDDYAPGVAPVKGSGKDDPTAKGSMYASLYISDNGGLTWCDRRHLQLRRAG
ncbi:MAG TPA: hypothetical protein VD902_19270 [Symbiobacteriaceae bacterium]|nr:hypothetical protein [Symbiobacteriaceae bacterium]